MKNLKAIFERLVYEAEQKRGTAINDQETYNAHAHITKAIGDKLLIAQGKKFDIDENNSKILKFLLYYFNDSEKALEVFPDENYSLDKQIMLIGAVGSGKTLLMQIFSEYTHRLNLDSRFLNVSITQMMNYYKLNNHLNQYTFNEQEGCFEGKPYNLCLNDLGLATHKHYGNDLNELIKDFLYARNDLYALDRKMAHITSNLGVKQLKELYSDEYGRLEDRFKTYNVIVLSGKSKR